MAPHGPRHNGNRIIFSDNILDKIRHFGIAFDTLPVDEKPKKIVFLISFDSISRLDTRRVKDEIIRVVSKDVAKRMEEFGMASEYETEVEVVELEDFFSTQLFYEHDGHIAQRVGSNVRAPQAPIETAKSSVATLTIPRQKQLTQLLKLNGGSISHNPQVLSRLLLDYMDSRGINYIDEGAIPKWIAQTFSSIETLRQYLTEFSEENPNHESTRSNHLRNKFFKFMDAKLNTTGE